VKFEEADALNEAIRAIGIRHRALAIAALSPLGIHPGHKLLLLELDRKGPSTQAQLAAASGYEPPTITVSIRHLENAGLVARRPSPSDARATIVELTPEGRALMPKVKAAWSRVAEQTAASVNTPLRQLIAVLEELASGLAANEPPVPDRPRYVRRA